MKMDAHGVATALTAKYVRKMGVGADVIQLSRKLDAAEANALLAQLRADPAVAYVEPDLLMQPADFLPNDPRSAPTARTRRTRTSPATAVSLMRTIPVTGPTAR